MYSKRFRVVRAALLKNPGIARHSAPRLEQIQRDCATAKAQILRNFKQPAYDRVVDRSEPDWRRREPPLLSGGCTILPVGIRYSMQDRSANVGTISRLQHSSRPGSLEPNGRPLMGRMELSRRA